MTDSTHEKAIETSAAALPGRVDRAEGIELLVEAVLKLIQPGEDFGSRDRRSKNFYDAMDALRKSFRISASPDSEEGCIQPLESFALAVMGAIRSGERSGATAESSVAVDIALDVLYEVCVSGAISEVIHPIASRVEEEPEAFQERAAGDCGCSQIAGSQ